MISEQKLEDTCEALQRATEGEILLRDKYVCLEEKQMQKTEQIEVTPSFIIFISNKVKYIFICQTNCTISASTFLFYSYFCFNLIHLGT